ncbi:MAG TPA: amidase [Trebonia sp.]|nr:amidase [Trebonia sp.]
MATWIVMDTEFGSGLRVAVKDLIDMAGLPTTAGCRVIADTAGPARQDATCLAGLRAAIGRGQARFVGKTNLHELAYGITGVNHWFGTPVNPVDPRRVPGGSSSGSATAVAAGEADVAYGTDTGGSIRIPAACCGIAGLKTTWGRISLDGVRPLAPSLDTVGPLAADVNGLIAGMRLLEPGFAPAAAAPQTVGRLAIEADPVVSQAVDDALRAAGFAVQVITIPELPDVIAASAALLEAQAWATNAELYGRAADGLGADVRERLRSGSAITDARLSAARTMNTRWKAALDGIWRRVELLAVPTLLGFPPLIDDAQSIFAIRGVTTPVNAAGLPALALPVPAPGGPRAANGPLPASIQLIGPANSEDRLLAAGAIVEAAVR